MMLKDANVGFIITYFDSNPSAEKLLEKLVNTMRLENYYLVLSSHSPVPQHIQEKCDFYIYEKLNAVDERQYSHGVAELSLIHKALLHLEEMNFNATIKVAYDISIINPSKFLEWIKYDYDFVTSEWGEQKVSTHSFFANINFLLSNLPFYKTFDEMVKNSNVVELAWNNVIDRKNLWSHIYSYKSAELMYGENTFNINYYSYDDLSFTYNREENRFYLTNKGRNTVEGTFAIYDYYTDICAMYYPTFKIDSGLTYWFIPPADFYIPHAENGFYMIMETLEGRKIRRNTSIKDYLYKHPMAKRFSSITYKECKYNEYGDFNNLHIYRNLNIPIEKIKTYLDIGANYGFCSTPFFMQDTMIYMVEADQANIDILNATYGTMPNVKIIPYAVYDVDGEITFYRDPLSVISSVNKDYGNGADKRIKVTIPSMTPDTLMKGLPDIDLMKIDIEGAEYVFFESISKESLRRINTMLIEFHLNKNMEVSQILKKLIKCGYKYQFTPWGDYNDPNPLKNEMGIIYAERI